MHDYDLDILQLAGKGYCCSQIILKLGLELTGEQNPSLIRASAALCNGISGSATCGALTGAACLISYHAGKGSDHQPENEQLPLMLAELSSWFDGYCGERFSGTRCSDIVPEGNVNPMICGGLVTDCFGAALTILTENGFDPHQINDR